MKPAMKSAQVKKITPLLYAEDLEPSIKFWRERLGFQKVAEIPEGGKIGFVILDKDGTELMYQSYASVEKDNAATAAVVRKGPTCLYVEVEDLDATMAATDGAEVFMTPRTTFYHAREFGIKEPAGHYIIFAQHDVDDE